jgi:hypothetical protein
MNKGKGLNNAKKIKLNLKDLKVNSFKTTSEKNVVGGAMSPSGDHDKYSCLPFNCSDRWCGTSLEDSEICTDNDFGCI